MKDVWFSLPFYRTPAFEKIRFRNQRILTMLLYLETDIYDLVVNDCYLALRLALLPVLFVYLTTFLTQKFVYEISTRLEG